MKICLLGATGRVGSVVLENAIADGNSISVLARDPEKVTRTSTKITITKGDVLDASCIGRAMAGTDAVISALNTSGTSTLSESMPLIIKNMKELGIKRIITIGTAGILQARSAPHLYRFQSSESKRKNKRDAEEHLMAYLILKNSGLDWTIVCPTYLPTGERLGEYRYEKDFLPVNPSSISVWDTGDFAYQQLITDNFIGYRVGLTY